MFWIMQQVVQCGMGCQFGVKYLGLYLVGKIGMINNNVDIWFVGIDGSQVIIIWVGCDNNQLMKLYGVSGVMVIYQCYLVNQMLMFLVLMLLEDVVDMGVDYDGNFVCSGGMCILLVWMDDLNMLCQQGEMMQQ